MKVPYINLSLQYKKYQKEIDRNIKKVISSTQFIGGEMLLQTEKKLANYIGTKHAIGCSSGTDALLLSLMALDLKKGDEVITTPFTFISTVEVILLLGLKVIFVDIERDTFNIDVKKIKSAITKKTKAIIPVSIFGQVADMKEINQIAKEKKIIVIEDAAQSFGTSYQKKKSCNLSTIGCTSFFPTKMLGAYGDGGAIFTNDKKIATKIRQLLNHGQDKPYHHIYVGLNARLDAMQCAIISAKLDHLDKEISIRKKIAEKYNRELQSDFFSPQKKLEDRENVYNYYCFTTPKRNQLKKFLEKNGIGAPIYYPIPLHQQPIIAKKVKSKKLPIAEEICSKILSIPCHPFMKKAEVNYVIKKIKEFNKKNYKI